MSSRWIEGVRSVALEVPDLARAEGFYTDVWRLDVAARHGGVLYLRGSGRDAFVLALSAGSERTQIRAVTLRARSAQALESIAAEVIIAGGRVIAPIAPLDEPAGGSGLTVCDPDGRIFQIVYGDAQNTGVDQDGDRPLRLAHVVLNSHDVLSSQAFVARSFGFTLADRTSRMVFMNCGQDHHSIAFGDADNDALNHVAFLMPGLDAVMRGGGRMKDAGYGIEWGPGRHGPGDNVFNYFVGPCGEVIEYTAEVEQIDDSYPVGGPDDWAWPAGRIDQWGIGAGPSARLKQAQRSVFFVASS